MKNAIPSYREMVGKLGQSILLISRSEIRKDAHVWAIGDHGGIIVLAFDEGVTDHILYFETL